MGAHNWMPNPSRKVPPSPGYPHEPDRFVRGNDLSPVAVYEKARESCRG
jgi:hypothetical protein